MAKVGDPEAVNEHYVGGRPGPHVGDQLGPVRVVGRWTLGELRPDADALPGHQALELGRQDVVQYQSGWTQTGTTIVSSLGWAATVSRGEARNISASAAAAPQVHTSHRHHIL